MVFEGITLSPQGEVIYGNPKHKNNIKRKRKKPKTQYSDNDMETFQVGLYYGKRLMEVVGYTKKFYKNGPSKKNKSWQYFDFVVSAAKRLEMSPYDFVEAQLWWFNKYFNIIPRPFDLSPHRTIKPSAIEVAENWKKIYGNCPSYYIRPKKKKEDMTMMEKQETEYYDKVLKTTMDKFNLTEGDVYLTFGTELFSEGFLNRQPVYLKLKQSDFI